MKSEKLAPLIFVLTAISVLGIGWLTRSSLPISRQLGRSLGGAIFLLGITMAFRSLWGIFAVFVLFLPAVVYRAKLEEEALAQKFGQSWDVYVANTSFFIPWLW